MPAYHVSCFLSQQCAEKYIKAFLQFHEQEIPKPHKLIDLLKLAKQVDTSLEILRPDLEELERYSVRVRYPGTTVDKEDARAAFSVVNVVRDLMRQKLKLATSAQGAVCITVLGIGAIIEEGNHNGLLAQEGHYANLYNTYFRHQSLAYVEQAREMVEGD